MAQIYKFIPKLTSEEYNILKSIVLGQNTLSEVYFRVFNCYPKNISYIKKRLTHRRFKKILLEADQPNSKLEWSWPKGKADSKDKNPIDH